MDESIISIRVLPQNMQNPIQFPNTPQGKKRPSKLDPHKDFIDMLLEEDNYSAALILEKLHER